MHHTRTNAAPPPLPRAVYVFVSHRLFLLTNVLKDAFIPHDDNRLLARNLILLAAAGVACTAVGFVGHSAIMVAVSS